MLWIIMQYSLVKLVVDGIAAQEIDNQLAKQSFLVLNWNIDRRSTTFAKSDNFVPHRPRDQLQKKKWKRLERILDAINSKNEKQRELTSHLVFSFSSTLGFPTRMPIHIEFARPHVSDKYPDYFCYPGLLWEYWKLSMRRGSHLEYNIHDTADLGIFEFSVHTIPGS